ncbi:PcfJ domain-containing protein, partial [Roseibium sp. RKSG952]|uniref:PcfJ domain-containing protein n=1 Tax=Roseibium sp. RKSG952 TaxID=2529384 RepID=UPI0018AD2010
MARAKFEAEIGDLLAPFAGEDERLAELLSLSVGRILLRLALQDESRFIVPDHDALQHIADWLKAAIVNDAPWLYSLDENGRPKKLMKLHLIEACTAEADKEIRKSATRRGKTSLIEGDEEPYADLEDGYSLIRLMTPSALDRESNAMQHCIGDGAYDDRLIEENLYLSLRDHGGKPHATLEITSNCLVQLQGKQNKIPVRRYLDRLIPFLKRSGWEISIPTNRLGHVVDADGDWHALDNLPEGLSVGG